MWTSLEQLQQKITARRVLDLFDDDGDGDLDGTDAAAVDEAIASANDEVTSILFRKGFSREQLVELAEDASLRRYATAILAQIAGERRTEFLDAEQRGPFHQMGERAREALVKMSRGELRSKKEEQAGENPIVGGDISIGEPVFIFARDPRYPGKLGPGGF